MEFSAFFRAGGRPVILALAVLANACSGHGDGGTGDFAAEPNPDVYGGGSRVDEVVRPARWYEPENTNSVDCTSPTERQVTISGLTVVAVDDFDELGDGSRAGNVYAVQTPGKKGLQPYSGITLRRPSFTPPDLRLFPGEVVDARGSFVEFLGPPGSPPFGSCKTLPQIEGTVTYRFDGNAVAPYPLVPAATEDGTNRWDVLTSYQRGRPYIGMLVRLENVTITDVTPKPSGDLLIAINVGGGLTPDAVPKISNELYDIVNTGPAMPSNGTFESITGIVTYFYGFKIAPRFPADIVRATTPI